MAVKLAHAMGAEVTLFTRSLGKSDDAYRLGASRVVLSTDENQMFEVANTFDVIIDTVPYTHDLSPMCRHLPWTVRWYWSVWWASWNKPLTPCR